MSAKIKALKMGCIALRLYSAMVFKDYFLPRHRTSATHLPR